MQTKEFDAQLDIKELTEDGSFSGYASVFGNKDSDGDVIFKGAFSKSIRGKGAKKIKMLWYHDVTNPIGKWESIKEDDYGLFVKGKLFINKNVPDADRAYTLMKEQEVDGMSVGFRMTKDGYTSNKSGGFDITEAHLKEISVVTFGANDKALVGRVKNEKTNFADNGYKWNKQEAETRIDKAQNTDSAYVIIDGEKSLIADVISDQVCIVPKAVFAAAGKVLASDNDNESAIEELEKYYTELELESPFEAKNMTNVVKSYIRAKIESSSNLKELEKSLREVGFSATESKAVANKLLPQREVEGLEGVFNAIKNANESIKTLTEVNNGFRKRNHGSS